MSDTAMARGVAVLADPSRSAILELMLRAPDGRVLVGESAVALGLTQPTVSHHMRALVDSGAVRREPDGRRTWYSIAPDQRDRIRMLLAPGEERSYSASDLVRIGDDLVVRFAGRVEPETVERIVRETHSLLAPTSHPRLLASRTAAFAAARLERLAGARDIPTVLFVCVQNAGRSQIAAAILRHLGGPRVRVFTAGSAPADDVRESIVASLDEIGIPGGDDFPKPLTEDAVRAADVIVTMGCGDVCEVRPGVRHLDWDVGDPVGQPRTVVRAIRDDIDRRVRELLGDIDPA